MVGTMSPKVLGWTFVATQVVLLGGLVLLRSADDWAAPLFVMSAARVIAVAGLVLAAAAAVGLGTALTATPVPKAQAGLRTGGLYRFARHPIYSGVLLFVIGTVVASRSFWKLAMGVATVVFFNVKARWEESQLRETYPDYGAYSERTGRFFPHLKFPRS
jgi:protein-S-isoprenylcysteine O-methyltransferase Ste14